MVRGRNFLKNRILKWGSGKGALEKDLTITYNLNK